MPFFNTGERARTRPLPWAFRLRNPRRTTIAPRQPRLDWPRNPNASSFRHRLGGRPRGFRGPQPAPRLLPAWGHALLPLGTQRLQILPAGTTEATDTYGPPNQGVCYIMAPFNDAGLMGLSDILCGI